MREGPRHCGPGDFQLRMNLRTARRDAGPPNIMKRLVGDDSPYHFSIPCNLRRPPQKIECEHTEAEETEGGNEIQVAAPLDFFLERAGVALVLG
jgi:hypothetical protein